MQLVVEEQDTEFSRSCSCPVCSACYHLATFANGMNRLHHIDSSYKMEWPTINDF